MGRYADPRNALPRVRSVEMIEQFEDFQGTATHKICASAVIGKIQADGKVHPVWVSNGTIAPEPWSSWLKMAASPVVRSHSSRLSKTASL